MAQVHRQRIYIGSEDNSSNGVKWVQGKSVDELNDNIVRAYLENNLLDRLLTAEDRRKLALLLLATLPVEPAENGLNNVVSLPTQAILFRHYTERWLRTYKEGVLKPTTLAGYRCNLNKHIYPALGDCPLPDITTDMIQSGLPFPEAAAEFLEWCGEDSAFVTWSENDIIMIEDNMLFHGMEIDGLPKCYDMQLLFDDQITQEDRSFALSYAMWKFDIKPQRSHDALNDAINTVEVLKRLDLSEGFEDYEI